MIIAYIFTSMSLISEIMIKKYVSYSQRMAVVSVCVQSQGQYCLSLCLSRDGCLRLMFIVKGIYL